MKTLHHLIGTGLLFGLATLVQQMQAGEGPDYSVEDLGTFFHGSDTVASAINNAGVVTGSGPAAPAHPDANNPFHPFIFPHGHVQDLGVPPGYQSGSAERINDLGQIILSERVDDSAMPVSFLYTGGQ